MEYSKEDLMEAKRQILGVGENMGTEESKKIWEKNAQFWDVDGVLANLNFAYFNFLTHHPSYRETYKDLKAADVLAACREAGLLVLTAKTRLRLLPPLTLSEHDVDMALEILSDVLGKMEPTAPKEQA